jgi:hypothetical protein
MLKRMIFVAIIVGLAGVLTQALAEKTTELYIPLGQSPGVSGKLTVIGKIERVDTQNGTLTLSNASGSYDVQVTESTKIYLDRSRLNQKNEYGVLADCRKGMSAEVRFVDDERGRPAEWIKLQLDG